MKDLSLRHCLGYIVASSLGIAIGLLLRPDSNELESQQWRPLEVRRDRPEVKNHDTADNTPSKSAKYQLDGESADTVAEQMIPEMYQQLSTAGRTQLFQDVFDAYASESPSDAAALLEQLTNLEQRHLMTETLIDAWSEADSISAYQWLQTQGPHLDDETQQRLKEHILHYMTFSEPSEAWDIIHSIPNSDSKQAMLAGLATGWAQKDPQAAFSWLIDLSETDVPTSTMSELYVIAMGQYMKADPVEAALAIQELESEALQTQLVESTVLALADQDLSQAMVWLQNLDNIAVTQTGMFQLIETYGSRQPETILTYVLNNNDSSPRGIDLLSSTFARISSDNPQLAIQHISSVPEDARTQATSALTAAWADNNEEQATAWVERQPAGAMRDGGAAALARHHLNTNPLVALQWVSQIQNLEARTTALTTMATAIEPDQLSALHTALATAPITADERGSLEATLNKRIKEENPFLVLPPEE
ncbi:MULTISPECIES: hypothetical protein [unclassified Lentimonas]|uniref:hypothetical protein n=1 Tax=unclassified Lentimonas TaxID=2630993 RepID=UPI0013232AA6|nr:MULTISPECIES: hypothetical protein [unclassified Lentimonas]CAA6679645.1 Unannotated [Lentimonas sp. CC4]CAA6683588.1 Unannotated [Lentimonas sp. CC6]CAA7077350.1 Unannotated [Lentimonas sp. CC4]CAA7170131.1 Unannotated [Lentimonas sp. CC21]CAA7182478.1 Unannotated [Lentimonas sp. CC8]